MRWHRYVEHPITIGCSTVSRGDLARIIGNRWSLAAPGSGPAGECPHHTDRTAPALDGAGIIVYRAGGRDQGVSGLGWSSPSTQMSARSL
jgi:hypothetical protein